MFIVIISIALWFSGTSTFVAYNSVKTPSYAAFEGFSQRNIPLEYTEVANPGHAYDDTYMTSNIVADKSECKKVGGLDGYGVFCSPKFQQSIDIFSQAKGKLNCAGSGYSNSKGSLCLDAKMKQQLLTRGMNSTGSDSQIGSR